MTPGWADISFDIVVIMLEAARAAAKSRRTRRASQADLLNDQRSPLPADDRFRCKRDRVDVLQAFLCWTTIPANPPDHRVEFAWLRNRFTAEQWEWAERAAARHGSASVALSVALDAHRPTGQILLFRPSHQRS